MPTVEALEQLITEARERLSKAEAMLAEKKQPEGERFVPNPYKEESFWALEQDRNGYWVVFSCVARDKVDHGLCYRTEAAAERAALANNILDEYRAAGDVVTDKEQFGLNWCGEDSSYFDAFYKLVQIAGVVFDSKTRRDEEVRLIGRKRLLWAWRVVQGQWSGDACPKVGQ